MADTATEAPEPDDGFTAEERTQFESMRDSPAPAPFGDTPAPEPAAPAPVSSEAPAPAQGAPSVGAAPAEGGEDDDDDEPAPAGTPGAPGEPARAPRRVSYSKFHRTEKQLTDALAKLSEREQTQARLDERLRILNEALTTPAAQQQAPKDEDPEPDPEADIFGHNAWLKRQLVRTQESIREMQDGSRANTAQQQTAEAYETDAMIFAQKEPNFRPAYNFLMASRIVELAEYFYGKDMTAEGATLTPQELRQIQSTVADEERQLVTSALKTGKSPAQRVFALAKARGFRVALPAQESAAAQAPKPNGNGSSIAAPPPRIPGNLAAAPMSANGANGGASVREEVDRIRNGADASLSLSSGGGAAPMALSAEKLANMDQDDFNALVDSMSPAEIKRLMGG